ncbi:MAG: hypothetical protein MK135_05090 [Polyangiaceae bacterium]|nr:hypothetical protein [Polyangiaceae bacterium]
MGSFRPQNIWLGFGLTLLSACSTPGNGIRGELGVGTFDYNCLIASDAACSESGAIDAFLAANDLGSDKDLPRAVAVGSRFGLSYAGTLSDEQGEVLVTTEAAASEDAIGTEAFQIDAPVSTSFVGTAADGRVVDLIYVEAATPKGLFIWLDQESVDSIELSVGDSLDMTFTLYDEEERLLGGAISSSWQIDDNDIVVLSEYQATGLPTESTIKNKVDITLSGQSAGSTELVVTAGAIERTIRIEVTP